MDVVQAKRGMQLRQAPWELGKQGPQAEGSCCSAVVEFSSLVIAATPGLWLLAGTLSLLECWGLQLFCSIRSWGSEVPSPLFRQLATFPGCEL